VRFVHETVRGFLQELIQTSSTEQTGGIAMDVRYANECLASQCTNYLRRPTFLQELSVAMPRLCTYTAFHEILKVLFDQHSFLSYASTVWTGHIRAVAPSSPSLIALIIELLETQIVRDALMAFSYYASISRKPDGHLPPIGGSPLHLAAYFDIVCAVEEYLLRDKSLMNVTAQSTDTPLIWASERGATASVSSLLNAGADANAYEYDNWSALHWAARNGHLGVAQLLLEHGARKEQTDRFRQTPIEWAIDRQHWPVVALLHAWPGAGPSHRLSPDKLHDASEHIRKMYGNRQSGVLRR
jgi:hypothetical protein